MMDEKEQQFSNWMEDDAPAPVPPPLPDIPQIQSVPHSARVLLIESDPDVRLSLHDFFELSGYEVVIAEDGKLDLTKLTAASDYDLILLDDHLPLKDRMNLVAEMRAKEVHVPVLIMAGQGDGMTTQMLVEDTIRYLPKPFSPDELIVQVDMLLGSK